MEITLLWNFKENNTFSLFLSTLLDTFCRQIKQASDDSVF